MFICGRSNPNVDALPAGDFYLVRNAKPAQVWNASTPQPSRHEQSPQKFRHRLEDEIKAAETSLAQAARHVTSATETGLETLEARLHETLAKTEAGRESAEHAGQRISHFLAETKNHAVSRLEDWKTDQIEKLEKLADKREQQAADAVVVAAYAMLQAEVAIVEALKARKIATEVSG